ncbi:hypothetical protein BJX70DRAFT_323522 [Aspergillus crustosus]
MLQPRVGLIGQVAILHCASLLASRVTPQVWRPSTRGIFPSEMTGVSAKPSPSGKGSGAMPSWASGSRNGDSRALPPFGFGVGRLHE